MQLTFKHARSAALLCFSFALASLLIARSSSSLSAQGKDKPAVDSTKEKAGPQKIVCGKIENCYEITPGLLSGGSPETDADFAALAARGVTHMISVDGKPPLLELAKKYNMHYVHLPIGYGKLSEKSMAQIAAAMPESKDVKVFMHCHHGKHRGPAAAAIACQATHGFTSEQALAWLKVAGTSPDYPGLFDAVRSFSKITKEEVQAAKGTLSESVAPPELVESMLEIDELFDAINAPFKSGKPAPAKELPADLVANATLLKEKLTELARQQHSASPEAFAKLLTESINACTTLETALRPDAKADIPKVLATVKATCTKCHAQTRDR